MEARYMLDTNICIYIRQQRHVKVLERFERLSPGEATLSVITYGELYYGAVKSPRRVQRLATLKELVQILPVLAMPDAAGEIYGELRAELETIGQRIGNNDLWIAAHARATSLTLVTNNEKEFSRVKGLKIQNWAA